MKTGCILVLYNPNWELLHRVIVGVTLQVNHLFIIDNSTTDNSTKFTTSKNTTYQSNGENVGIATAQNKGIHFFEERKYDFVLLLDQDSIAPPNMVSTLKNQYNYLINQQIKVGGICARTFNRENNQKEIGRIKKGRKINNEITEVSQIISSGSLIPLAHFNKIGYLEDALFIDGVDFEWCWRAKAKEIFRFFIVENTLLSHKRGEGDKHILFFRIAISSPERIYYQYRNYFILIKRKYVPLYWKVSNFIKYFIKYIYYSICTLERNSYLRKMNKGIKDGIKDFL